MLSDWRVYDFLSGNPEGYQLPAGMADKPKLVLYHPLHVGTKKQKENMAAVRQCSGTYGNEGQKSAAAGTVVLPRTSGRPVF